MKRLSPAKRNQLIGVLAATVGLICCVYFLLISPQNSHNHDLLLQIDKESRKLDNFKSAIKQMDATTKTLAGLSQQLDQQETDIASGDLYSWTYDTMRRFKASYHVDIPTVGQPILSDCDLIGNFPYRQIRFTISGTGYYHELGKFVADFENKFPHCRVLNVHADPADTTPGAGERLAFRMDIVALVKPND